MSEDPYVIRKAGSADLERLLELLLALQDHVEEANPALWRMTSRARDYLRHQISVRLQAPRSCVLVAEHRGDGVVGLIFGRVVTNSRYSPSRAGVVDQVYVRPDHRRRALGAQLVSELCTFFAAEPVTDVSLRLVSGNQEAAAFWAALGFSPRIITVGAGLETVQSRLRTILTA